MAYQTNRTDDPDINELNLRLYIAAIALLLPLAIAVATWEQLPPSISHSYWAGDWARNLLVGAMVAIAFFLLAYRHGSGWLPWLASKLAAVCAAGVALFPVDKQTHCGEATEGVGSFHLAFAITFFLVLLYFCREFAIAAKKKRVHPNPAGLPDLKAPLRSRIYWGCFAAMAIALLTLFTWVLAVPPCERPPHLVFAAETIVLFFFGVAWLVASRLIPGLHPVDARPREPRFLPKNSGTPTQQSPTVARSAKD